MTDVEVIIKIPEVLYWAIKQNISTDSVYDAVKNGTLLPKGHGDLIDRKELLKQPIDKTNYPSNYVRVANIIIEADREEQE